MSRQRDVLTTGDVALICKVAPRTVSKWFDSGKLKGYRIPGSKDRRIPRSALMHFMKEHQIPINGLKSGATRLLMIDGQPDWADETARMLEKAALYEVKVADSVFASGLICERFRPHAIVLDADLPGVDPLMLQSILRSDPDLQFARLLVSSARLTEGQGRQLLNQGIDAFLKKPLAARTLAEAVEQAVSLIF